MSWTNADIYSQAGQMPGHRGWQSWLGDDEWARVTDLRLQGDDVLITVDHGRTFRSSYVDAVRCRRPEAPALMRPISGSSACLATAL